MMAVIPAPCAASGADAQWWRQEFHDKGAKFIQADRNLSGGGGGGGGGGG